VWNNFYTYQGFSRCFRDPIRVSRIREHYHRLPRIKAIGSLQVYTRFLKFSFKKKHLHLWLFAGNSRYYHVIFYNRSCTFVMCTPGPYPRTDDQFFSIWRQTFCHNSRMKVIFWIYTTVTDKNVHWLSYIFNC